MPYYDQERGMILPLKFNDEDFFSVASNVNIYSLAVVERPTGPAEVLLAATNKVYHISSDECGTIKKELDIPCLSGKTEIASIAAYIERGTGQLHYAFTTIVEDEGDTGAADGFTLHVHSPGKACQRVALPSLPCHLYHHTVPTTHGEQDVWLITGHEIMVVGRTFCQQQKQTQSQPDEEQEQEEPFDDTRVKGRIGMGTAEHMKQECEVPAITVDGKRINIGGENVQFDESKSLINRAETKIENKYSHKFKVSKVTLDEEATDKTTRTRKSNIYVVPAPPSVCDKEVIINTLDKDQNLLSNETGSMTDHCEENKNVDNTEENKYWQNTGFCSDKSTKESTEKIEVEPEESERYELLPTKALFPEFADVNFRVIKMHIIRSPDTTRRISAICGENGSLCIYDIKLEPNNEGTPLAESNPPPDNKQEEQATKSKTAAPRRHSKSRKSNSDSSDRENRLTSKDRTSINNNSNKDLTPPPPAKLLSSAHKAKLFRNKRFEFEYLLSDVMWFQSVEPRFAYPDTLPHLTGVSGSLTPDLRLPAYNLLATNTIVRSSVYWGAMQSHHTYRQPLASSCLDDSVLCCLSCHLTGDGRRYLLLGTYGQSILIYSPCPAGPLNIGPGPRRHDWHFVQRMLAGAPVLALAHADITGDGVKQLLALTAAGLQTWTLDVRHSARVLSSRLNKLLNIPPLPSYSAPAIEDDSDHSDGMADMQLTAATKIIHF